MAMIEVDPSTFEVRPFHVLDQQWAILVGGKVRPNPMTVSWGGFGTLWNRPVLSVYVRPTRHTFACLTEHLEFTLNFLPEAQRAALDICGTVTGRDQETDKWELAKIEPESAARVLVPRVAGAALVFECRVLGHVDLDPSHFNDRSLQKLYPQKDYHRAFFGEVLGIFQTEK